MTIIGISGCMALLVGGFALLKSNNTVSDIQFSKLIKYKAIVMFDDDFTKEDKKEYYKTLKNLKEYKSSLNVYRESVTFSKKNVSKQNATMYVPENVEKLENYILLNDRKTNKVYTLSNNGAIINEKLAKVLNVSVGDEVILTDVYNNNHKEVL